MPWLRTELWIALGFRSRALGPMLTPPAGGLWPGFLRFGPRSPAFFDLHAAESVCALTRPRPLLIFVCLLSTVKSESDRIAVLTDYLPFESGRRSFCP